MELEPYVFTTPLFETVYWNIFLARDQLYLGRSIVILKRECSDLADLNSDEITDFFAIVRQLENLYRNTFGAVMFNWGCLMNDAYKDSNPKPQVHWHCRPRYNKPIEVAGVVFEDPNFGHHYLRERENKRVLDQDVYSKIVSIIQDNL